MGIIKQYKKELRNFNLKEEIPLEDIFHATQRLPKNEVQPFIDKINKAIRKREKKEDKEQAKITKKLVKNGELSEDWFDTCCLCGKRIPIYEWHNPWPLENNFPEDTPIEVVDSNWKRCCPKCDKTKVLLARVKMKLNDIIKLK